MKLKILFIALFISGLSWGQTNIIAGGTYTENFNGLGASATAALPTNWKAQKTTTVRDLALSYPTGVSAVELAAGNSMSTTAGNGIYRYNANGSTAESALGGLSSSSASKTVAYMSYFNNNGTSSLDSFTISYDVEKYRNGSNAAGFTIDLLYSTDGTTWVTCGGSFTTSFSPDADNAGYATAPNTTISVSSTYTPAASIAASGKFYFAWRYSVTSGATTSNAQALGFDNVSITGVSTCAASVAGSITLFSSTCGSSTLTYGGADAANCYWQTSSTGTSFANVATSNYTTSTSGTYYIRSYNGTCWSSTFASSTITISNNPTITSSPSNSSIIETNNTSFSVTVTNPGTYQWQVDYDGDGTNDATVTNTGVYSGATTATLTITGATLAMSGYKYQCIVFASAPCIAPAVSGIATLTVTPNVTYASDIVSAAGEASTISSTVNNTTIATSSNGVQVWQFTVRDGGGTADADAYPTILTGFTIAQVGNTVSTWTDAIYSIGLFDGTTFIANGTVSATQIVFSGLNVSVADGSSKTLSLRLSLKCPLGANAFDNDHFGFSISYANTTFSPSGSGRKATFTAAASASPTNNVIDVTATKLLFTTQPPASVGLNTAMSTVVVKAYDACGNFDSSFTGAVSLTSTGTMTAVTPVNAVAGVATFTGVITHTVLGTGLILTASSPGVTPITSTSFNVVTVTAFNPGELIFVGYDGRVSSSDDEYLIATMVDIKPGTQFSIVNSRYEAGAPANVRTNKWGGGGNIAEDPPYVALITYIGSTNIPAGSVLSIITNGTSNWFGQIDVITGTTTTTRTSEFTGSLVFGTTYNPNISVSGTDADEIFLMQGSFVSDGSIDIGQANYILSGTLLHGLTNRAAWVPLTSACNGGTAGGSTRESRLPTALQCFNVENASSTGESAFYKNDKEHGLATIRQIINAIANVATNWTLGSGRYTKDPTSSLATRAAKTFSIGTSNPGGTWIGDVSGDNTNWFNCGNWEGLTVPDSNTNVILNASSLSDAKIDYTAPFSDNYMDIAYSKNLTVSNRNVKLEASINNILEVHGDVLMNTTGGIDMDDSSSATADGIIKLYGNWTNSVGNAAFSEGNGTVQFVGSTPQVISSVANEGTEVFYNVVLDNNFDTAVSNDLIASGDLTVKTGRTVSIDSNGFIKAYKKLDHSGTFTIEDNGQFIQVDETDANVGTYNSTTFKVKRIADVNQSDYVYWSSPTNAFDQTNILSNGMRLIWNTTFPNADTQGNWNWASTEPAPGVYPAMTKGKGYAIAVPNSTPARPLAAAQQLTTFTGKPNNGSFTFPISKGTITANFTNAAGVPTTMYDDNWNLVGNPYPSAIDADLFLNANATIEGTVWIWRHGKKPDSSQSPFYSNFEQNYYSTDYCKYNKMGATLSDFSGQIASGQGFMVNMLETFVGSNSTITFSNSMRSNAGLAANPYAPFINTDFYRTANNATADNLGTVEEKSRIWMDIINNASNQTDTTLLGYSTNSTLERDHFYDAIFVPRGAVAFYSLINNETFIIQGRPLPLDKEDKVPMGINITEAGAHTIAISKVDGVFAEDTNIYLEDKLLNIIHDLKQAPYVFNSAKGIFNNRFVIRYTNQSLGNNDFNTIDRNVVVSTRNGEMTINSYIENLEEVTVYDILGRQLLEAKSIANNVFITSSISASQQALLVKIKLANGTVVTRKIIL